MIRRYLLLLSIASFWSQDVIAMHNAEQSAQNVEIERLQRELRLKDRALQETTQVARKDREALAATQALLKAREQELRTKDEVIFEAIGNIDTLQDELDTLRSFKRRIDECAQAQEQLDREMNLHLLKIRQQAGSPIDQSELSPLCLAFMRQSSSNLGSISASFCEDGFKSSLFSQTFDLMQKAAVASYFNRRPELFKARLATFLAQACDASSSATHMRMTFLLGEEEK